MPYITAMNRTVDISIPVEPEVAAALLDPVRRQAIGRMVSRIVHPNGEADPLLLAMQALGEEAARRGLTAEILDQELAAHKAERQRLRPPPI